MYAWSFFHCYFGVVVASKLQVVIESYLLHILAHLLIRVVPWR